MGKLIRSSAQPAISGVRRTAVALGAAALLASFSAAGVAQGQGSSGPAPDAILPLQEFRTANDAGWFYTLNPVEAGDAAAKHKFTKAGDTAKLHTAPAADRVEVHRLRLKNGGPSYMLSISAQEFRDGRFVDEGVLGYADKDAKPGKVKLLRFTNNGKWRVVREGTDPGKDYKLDGPIGFANV